MQRALKMRGISAILLDGDKLRDVFFSPSMSEHQKFDTSERENLGLFYGRLAKLTAEQGFWVLVSTISMRKSVFDWNRDNLPNYYEILIDLPLEILQARDPKKIYADFKSGRRDNVIGLDIEAERPRHPELVFNESNLQSPEQMAELALRCIDYRL
jgi:cytidine diphosphoramidate kinase